MLLFQFFNGHFTWRAHRLACIFQETGPFTRFAGLCTGEGHARWLADPKHGPVRYTHLGVLPELWRRGAARDKPDPDRIAQLEDRYGLLWRYAIADRNLGFNFYGDVRLAHTELRAGMDQNRMLCCLQEFFDYYEGQFEAERPDAVFFHTIAGAPALVGGAVCGHFKIPFFSLGLTLWGDRRILSRNATMQPDESVGAYAAGGIVVSREVEDWYDRVASDPVLRNVRERNAAQFRKRYHGSLWALGRHAGSSLVAALSAPKKPYPHDIRVPRPMAKWLFDSKTLWGCRDIVRSGLFDDHPPEGDFVYFALAVTPEQSTCILGPQFVDQFVVISLLAQALPAGWRLVVKEHLPMLGIRKRSFYERLKALPNVVLVEPWQDPSALIKKARAVAAITGTTPLEATMVGTPVLLFGDVWYTATGLVRRCERLDDLSGELREARRLAAAVDPPARKRRITSMVQAVQDRSFPFSAHDIFAQRTDALMEELEPRLRGLAERLGQAAVRARDTGDVPDPFDASGWRRDRTPPDLRQTAAGGP